MPVRLFVVFFLFLVVSGCAGLGSSLDKPRQSFESENDDFMQRVRWRDINGAARHISEPNRQAFRDQFEDADDLKITDVVLKSVEFSADNEQVDSVVLVEYYRLPSTSVKTHRYKLHWTYFGTDQPTPVGWQITGTPAPIP